MVAPAVLGLAAGVLVVGAATSPRRWFPSSRQGDWLFAFPFLSSPKLSRYVALGVYFLGTALLGVAWIWFLRVVRRRRCTTAVVLVVFGLWVAPFAVGPPVGSDDAVTYAAVGKLVERGLNPSEVGIIALGTNDPFVRAASPVWWESPQPYGPLFLRIAGVAKELGGSSLRATVLVLRITCLVCLMLLVWPLAALARRFGTPPPVVLAAFLCSPLVLVHLVGGVHNEAVMLLPLVTGVALGAAGLDEVDRRRRLALVVCGIALCGVAATVKVPAMLGAAVLGWLTPARGPWWRRALVSVAAIGLATLVVVVISVGSGLGLAWLRNLDVPQKVDTLLAPFNAVGALVQHLLESGGWNGDVLPVFRGAGFAIGLAVACVGVIKADRIGLPLALGAALLVLALTTPVVWAWYFIWGLVFVAVRAMPLSLQLAVVVLNLTVTPLGPGTLDVNGHRFASALLMTVVWSAVALTATRRWRPPRASEGGMLGRRHATLANR